ncbi:MAG: cytidine deaminase [Verrucomicrobiales bacterium]|nr:cytidine deaminase [Verrucomicrobiales bacterium]|tara:strand:- start:55174 stop:55575 length:402 start_codon:yes stop_codon:yes gene_type:complete
MTDPDLTQAALDARARAHAPYSRFQVGAALRTIDGDIITGANVESASYGLSCCAERVTLFKAMTDGHSNFTAMAIASPGGAPPCGACRQLLAEQAPTATLHLIDSDNPESTTETTTQTLLPNAFTGDQLPSDD